MSTAQTANGEQATLWNGIAGAAWVEAQQTLDQILAPFTDLLLEGLASRYPGRVLDVGCGTGNTTVAAAQALTAGSSCVGIDISQPMIDAARARAQREHAPATFLCADAQTHEFAARSFGAVISRFGVMFFDDNVRAFANLRQATREGGELRFIAWRDASQNSFMTTAERAAAPLLPNIPARQPDAPGQFAFADQRKVKRILEESGWREIEIHPVDVACSFAEQDLTLYVTRLGPLGRVLGELNEALRQQVVTTVRAAFEPYVTGSEVRFNAACWLVSARA